LHHQYGHYSQGADAEYVVQSIKSVFPLPAELEFEFGAMVDTASSVLHSVKRPGIERGDLVVVVGAGPMGLLTAECALALGAGSVVVTDSGACLERAAELGFAVVNYRDTYPVAAVRGLSGGRGTNVAMDAGGTTDSIRPAVDA